MTVLFLAAIHALPILIVGLVTGSRSTLNLVTLFMCVIAVIIGGNRYAGIDLLAIGISYGVIFDKTKYSGKKLISKKHSIEDVPCIEDWPEENTADPVDDFGELFSGEDLRSKSLKSDFNKKKKDAALLLISKSNPLKFLWGKKCFAILYAGNNNALKYHAYEDAIFTMVLLNQDDMSCKAYVTAAKDKRGVLVFEKWSGFGVEISKNEEPGVFNDIEEFVYEAVSYLDLYDCNLRVGPFLLALDDSLKDDYIDSRLSNMEVLSAETVLQEGVNFFKVSFAGWSHMVLYKGMAPSLLPYANDGAIFTIAYTNRDMVLEAYVTAVKDKNGDTFFESYSLTTPHWGSDIFRDVDPNVYVDIKIFIEFSIPFLCRQTSEFDDIGIFLAIKKQILSLDNDIKFLEL